MTARPAIDGTSRPVVALCGGIGGAKLALGLQAAVGPRLAVVVNTGDDFEHLGLHISPDIDTVLYTLAGLNDRERGWGRAGETWSFMQALAELGGETWFNLGDRDLALHVERTRRLRGGGRLSAVTQAIAGKLGIAARILPMSDDSVRTHVLSDEGELPFQRYFVARRCEPAVRSIEFRGADRAAPSPEVTTALQAPDLAAVILCPSNPYLSIDPILSLPAIRAMLRDCAAPVVAVSPIVGGQAIKGPTAKIMAELGISPTSASVAAHYVDFLDGIILDETDRDEAARLPIPSLVTGTVMVTDDDRIRLAREAIGFAATLAKRERR